MYEPRLTRRECLVRGAGAVVTAGAFAAAGYALHDPLGTAGQEDPAPYKPFKNFFANVEFPKSNAHLAVASGPEDKIDALVRATIQALDPEQGIRRFISRGDVVVLKPNVAFDRPPHLGATTHPEVMRTLIRLCKEAGAARIIVTDFPVEDAETCFRRSGIAQVVAAEGAQLRLPTEREFETVRLREAPPEKHRGEVVGAWKILHRPFVEADKVIDVAPVKDHGLAGGTMSLKNWYGLIGGRRHKFHQAINEVISDFGLFVSPTLVVNDGTRVMLTNGPTGGRPTDVAPGGKLGRPTIVASVDPVACDAWCYDKLMGRDSKQLGYLELTQKKVAPRIKAGENRFASADWKNYEREGKLTVTSV